MANPFRAFAVFQFAMQFDSLLGGTDLILDGTDNFETRYLINDYAVKNSVAWIYAAAVGSYAVTMNILPGETACLACIFPESPRGTVETCETAGILNSAVNLVASIAATEALKFLVGARSKVREQALFWLAQQAGQKVSKTITDAIENDPDTDVKKKAVFALSEMPREEGVPLLIDQARKNRNPVVRKEAIFWLGQSEDPRALDFIASILER